MGDRKPSQFLRHLKGLAPNVPDDFLRTIWASRLPPHVQAILAGQTEGSLDSASHLADRICEVTPLLTTASVFRSTPDSIAGLLEHIEELTRQVAHTTAVARSPEAATARNPVTAAATHLTTRRRPTTPAGTTGNSGTKTDSVKELTVVKTDNVMLWSDVVARRKKASPTLQNKPCQILVINKH